MPVTWLRRIPTLAIATWAIATTLSGDPAAQTTGPGVVRLSGPCSAQPGTTVTFDVETVNFTSGVVGVQGTVAYDPAALQLVDVTAPQDGPFTGGPRVSLEVVPGQLRFAALDCGSASPGTEIPVAARLRFQVLAPVGAGLTLGLADVVALDAAGSSLAAQAAGASLLVYELPDRDCDGIADADDNCPDIANPDQTDSNANGIGDDCEPLFTELVSFQARRWSRQSVLITWETASELGTIGFHLSRGPSPTGPWTRLTESPIPAAGSETTGAEYEFVDRRVFGRVYYLLTEVGALGRQQSFPPIDVRGPSESDRRWHPGLGGGGS